VGIEERSWRVLYTISAKGSRGIRWREGSCKETGDYLSRKVEGLKWERPTPEEEIKGPTGEYRSSKALDPRSQIDVKEFTT